MRKHILVVLIFFCSAISSEVLCQYFQQNVSYNISASQDTTNHTISATCDISYTNNSPSELDTIFLHLWANAFSDKLSAYSNQALRMGRLEFYFADEDEMGGYHDLEVNVDGKKMTLYSWKGNSDVV